MSEDYGTTTKKHWREKPVEDRLFGRVAAGPNGCWIWTGPLNTSGYGQVHFTRRNQKPAKFNRLAHRLAYELMVGPIPEGLTIDHLCRVRRCINPAHLEAVTSQENSLRSPNTRASRWGHRTHCENGHEFTEENTARMPRWDNPEKFYRACRTCRRAKKAQARRLAKRAEAVSE